MRNQVSELSRSDTPMKIESTVSESGENRSGESRDRAVAYELT